MRMEIRIVRDDGTVIFADTYDPRTAFEVDLGMLRPMVDETNSYALFGFKFEPFITSRPRPKSFPHVGPGPAPSRN